LDLDGSARCRTTQAVRASILCSCCSCATDFVTNSDICISLHKKVLQARSTCISERLQLNQSEGSKTIGQYHRPIARPIFFWLNGRGRKSHGNRANRRLGSGTPNAVFAVSTISKGDINE